MPRSIDTVEEYWDVRGTKAILSQHRRAVPESFAEAFASFLGQGSRVVLTDSGRGALAMLLGQLERRNRTRVFTPRFICSAVPAAVRRAGWEPDPYDLASVTGTYDWERLLNRVTDQHAAIVVPHLFGVPTDLRPLLDPLSARGIAIIEDCAHCVGGTLAGKPAGALADASFFSFAFDKPVSLGGGGALALNPSGLLAGASLDHQVGSRARDLIGLGMLRRMLASRRARLSGAGSIARIESRIWTKGKAQFRATLGPIGPVRAALGLWQLERYNGVMKQRSERAAEFARECSAPTWGVPTSSTPAWLHQKAIMSSSRSAALAAQDLQSLGIRAGVFHWPVPAIEKPQGADLAIAEHGLDVPIHQNVTSDDVSRMVAAIASAESRYISESPAP